MCPVPARALQSRPQAHQSYSACLGNFNEVGHTLLFSCSSFNLTFITSCMTEFVQRFPACDSVKHAFGRHTQTQSGQQPGFQGSEGSNTSDTVPRQRRDATSTFPLRRTQEGPDFQVENQPRAAYIGRIALVPIHQCPSQKMSSLKIFSVCVCVCVCGG